MADDTDNPRASAGTMKRKRIALSPSTDRYAMTGETIWQVPKQWINRICLPILV